jgi:hypothetical protein
MGITLIYRKRDRLIVGASYPRSTTQQTGEAIIAEIGNICNSELGGVRNDYATVETEGMPLTGDEHVIDEDGTVSTQRKTLTASERAYQRKSRKLLALGLTQEEIDA